MLDGKGSTAKTLTLVAIVLQAVFFVIGIFEVIAVIALVPLGGVGFITLFFAFGFLVGILWILLDYFLIYKKVKEEKVREAETPALVLGILQLIFGGFIPGILLIVAYVELKDSKVSTPGTPL